MSTSDAHPVAVAWEQYLRDHDRERLFQAAVQESNHDEAFQWLLWQAIGSCDWELARVLEDRQVPLPEEKVGMEALLYGAVYDFGDVPEAIEWLLKRGARIDARLTNDWTALDLACRMGHLGTVRTLVKHGADVNARTSCDGGWTPLMQASAAGNKQIVEFLLGQGADPEIKNTYEGGTAREIAANYGRAEVAAVLDRYVRKPRPSAGIEDRQLDPFLRELRAQLERLTERHRIAFAAQTCERLYELSKLRSSPDADTFRVILDRVWEHVVGRSMEKGEIQNALDKCLRLDISSKSGIDAAVALRLTLGVCRDPSAGNAAKAGRNARDVAVRKVCRKFPEATRGELTVAIMQKLEKDPLMIKELKIQHDLLEFLRERPELSEADIISLREGRTGI